MRYQKALMLTVGFVCLGACSDTYVPHAKSTTGRAPTVAEFPEKDELVRGEDDPAVITLDFDSRFKERRLAYHEELPSNVYVPTTNLKGVPVSAALQAVLQGTDISLSWETGDLENRLVSVANLSGPLSTVISKICSAAKVFYTYRHGQLEIKERETFVIELPMMPLKASGVSTSSATNSMAEALEELAGQKVRIDPQGGNLIYETDVQGQERVREYLAQLQSGRPLVVLQLYIWEVTLDKDKGTGINWKNFNMNKIGGRFENVTLTGSSGFGALTSPGVSLGATIAGKINAENVLQFLSTQGQVQTISNPQLTFVSGSIAEFKVGGKQRYISQVGQLSNSSTSSTSSSVSSNTVSTDSLETGLKVSVNGLFEGGVISAAMELSIDDVVSLNPTQVEDLVVDLPETSERKVTTTLRVRPGDNLVLAGLVTSRDTNDRDYIPLPFGGRIPTFTKDSFKNTELVVFVKPSVVLFADSGKNLDKDKAAPLMPVVSKPKTRNIDSQAILIDKDGAQYIKPPKPVIVAETGESWVKSVAPQVAPVYPTAMAISPIFAQHPQVALAAQQPVNLISPRVLMEKNLAPVGNSFLQNGLGDAFDNPSSSRTRGERP